MLSANRSSGGDEPNGDAVPRPRRRGRASYRKDLKAIDRAVGGRLRRRRVMLGHSQTTLAMATGLTFQQVQKYESGANRISSSRLFEFCRVLKVPVSYFFDGLSQDEGDPDPVTKPTRDAELHEFRNLMNKRETLEFIRAYNGIEDPKLRREFVALVKRAASN
ncbi:MAG: helix-turn-helix transcriptional regulator [Proteobacteria bacterium]|nr:helix-turn-helix transcriptional regulator [Pseudomonadota bacterium]